MASARDQFLRTVRDAVRQGNGAGAPPHPERGVVGYQGAGDDPATRFCQEFAAAGGMPHRVADAGSAVEAVLELARSKSARHVLVGRGAFLDTLPLAGALRGAGVETLLTDEGGAAPDRDAVFRAEIGISGVDYLIAETGSIALLSRPDQPRSLSLLPPVHVAVAHRGQLLPDLFDLFAARLWAERRGLPACLSLVTGPSKTGDIELKLVTGVHGPGEVHLVLVER